MKKLSALCLVFFLLAGLLPAAMAAGGTPVLAASVGEAAEGEAFTVTLTVPGVEKKASDAYFCVAFDNTRFTLTRFVPPELPGASLTCSDEAAAGTAGIFSCAYISDDLGNSMDFSGGLSLTAEFLVKPGAAGSGEFRLVSAKVDWFNEETLDTENQLTVPAELKTTVVISDASGVPEEPAEPAAPSPAPSPERAASPYRDVPENAYYRDAVLWASARGITKGTEEARFSPDAPCTRAQTVTFLWRAAGMPEPGSGDMPFEDVKPGSYYEKAVRWALAQGVTKGVSETRFAPEDTVTRAQTVTFLWRAAGLPAVNGTLSFADVAQSAYYAAAVKWAEDSGITVGVGDGLFGPELTCTRAQIVTFLCRAYGGE